jgi:hypothetical protein
MLGSLFATVFIPPFQNSTQMLPDESADYVQLMGFEALVASERQRLKPELAGLVLALHVNVRRLSAVEAREKEPVRSGDTLDSWHSRRSLPAETQAIAYPDAAAPLPSNSDQFAFDFAPARLSIPSPS